MEVKISSPLSSPSEKLEKFPTLEEISVTTMVVIASFSPVIDINALFPLLPMATFTPFVKNSKKVQLPHLKTSSLLSARYNGVVLGNVIFSRPRFFKNAIIIDMSASQKNVNIKISKSKLQMCGIKTVEMAEEAAHLVFEHIAKVAQLLLKIRDDHLQTAFDYVSSQDESHFEEYSSDEDKEILARLIYPATKCTDLQVYKGLLTDIGNLAERKLLSQAVRLEGILEAMVNYNFSLRFKINRGELSERINGRNQFTARYRNTLDHSVTIEHPHNFVLSRKKESPHVTFTVYKSGILTISGPNFEIIQPIYNKFIKIIEEIRPFITLNY